ncbi:hypothetical protein [Variovorax sp. DAIF25]|uniref:hypothetical protein n=1 Tax=Variovorax sp. DAIF25 TaxID=3080983 RepID=UPI003D6B4B5B
MIISTPDFLAQFFRDGWEVRCAVTRAAPNGNLSGRAEILRQPRERPHFEYRLRREAQAETQRP